MLQHLLRRTAPTATLAAAMLVFAGGIAAAAQSTPSQADNLRFRTGLTSASSHHEVIVRVTELESSAGSSDVALLVIDRRDRVIARVNGTVKSGRAFEFTLPASRLGNDPRELFRVDLLLANRSADSEPIVHVDISDPFDLGIERPVICAGRAAGGNGPIGLCEGAIVDFESP